MQFSTLILFLYVTSYTYSKYSTTSKRFYFEMLVQANQLVEGGLDVCALLTTSGAFYSSANLGRNWSSS